MSLFSREYPHLQVKFSRIPRPKRKNLSYNKFSFSDKFLIFNFGGNQNINNIQVYTPHSYTNLALIKALFLKYTEFFFWISNSYTTYALHFKYTNSVLYYLDLNFLRKRFFPQVSSSTSCLTSNFTNTTIFNGSLGLISKFFSNRKNFLRSKSSYVLLTTYLRRVLININLFRLRLNIVGLPLHLKPVLSCLLSKSNSLYMNPFKPSVILNEKDTNSRSMFIHFLSIHFLNNKFYGYKKVKKKGRLKRKIWKKVVVFNNIVD